MGFVTLFSRDGRIREATAVPVTAAGSGAYPNAMAVRLESAMIGTRLSQYRDEYAYQGLSTDALLFAMTRGENATVLSFCSATTLTCPAPGGASIRFEGFSPQIWKHESNMLSLRISAPADGVIRITV